MAVTHSTAARNAATDAVTALIGASGKLVFRTSGTLGSPGTAVATLTFSADAFADSTGGTATANAITPDLDATGHASPVATATIETSAGTIIIHCSVGLTGSDINMTNGLTIAPGDRILCLNLTYTGLPQ